MSLLCVSNEEFILTWKIKNSIFTADACLESPIFPAENLLKTKWSLQVFVEIVNGFRKLLCILKRAGKDEGPDVVCIHFEIRLGKASNSSDCIFSKDTRQSVILFHDMGFLQKNYLKKGPWIIQCKMSMWDDEPHSTTIHWFAGTRIRMTNLSRMVKFSWVNRKITEAFSVNLHLNSMDGSFFTVTLKLDISIKNEVTVKIKNLTNRNVFLSGKISVRNDQSDFLYSTEDSFILGNDAKEWDFPFCFSKEMATKLLSSEAQINNLCLLFEFFIPDGIESSIQYSSNKTIMGQGKTYIHRHIKSKNVESQTTDLTCASKLICSNDTVLQTINDDYRKLSGEYFTNTDGKKNISTQVTKSDCRTNVGMQTSNIYFTNSASQNNSHCARSVSTQISANFKDVYAHASTPKRYTSALSHCEVNIGMQTSKIYCCENASSHILQSTDIGIQVSDVKDISVQTSLPERDSLEMASPKSKLTKLLQTAPTFSRNFDIEPLILTDQSKECRFIDCTIKRSESQDQTSNNQNVILIEELCNQPKTKENRGCLHEDVSSFQTFPSQIDSDMMQDYLAVFFPHNKLFFFIVSIITLCLSLFYGCFYFSIPSSTGVKRPFLFNSSVYVKSNVFNTIFQINITETEYDSQMIMVDLDVESVNNFLAFMISKEIENFPREKVINLLFVNYEHYLGNILEKRIISVLASRLSVSNVCEILIIGDANYDTELKYAAREFIFLNANEVFASNEWKNLMLSNTQLANEVIRDFSFLEREKKRYITYN